MSDACKNAYNACLNSCPEAPRQGASGPPNGPGRIDIGIASCTAGCNEQANKCK